MPNQHNNYGWIFYALLSATATAVLNINMAVLVRQLPLLPVITAVTFTTSLFLLPFYFFTVRQEHRAGRKIFPNRQALHGLLGAAGLDFLGFLMFNLALKWGPISVVTPLRNTVPLFSLMFAPRLLKESASRLEKLGIVLVVLSAVVLVWTTRSDGADAFFGFTPPIIGALLLALSVAIISAIILIANKYATGAQYGQMHVIVFTTLDHLMLTALFALLTMLSGSALLPPAMLAMSQSLLLLIIATGAIFALASFGVIKACQVGDTVKVSPVLRLSVLFSVIFGGALFMEAHLWLRIIASVVFIIGLLPVIIFQEKKKQTLPV